VKKPRTRSQYRRLAWEDYCEATLFALDLFDDETRPLAAEATEKEVAVPVWLLRNWSADLAPMLAEVRRRRAEVYRTRHADKTRIFHPADQRRPADFAKAITDLAKMFREEMLAVDGVRFAAKGVHRVRKKEGLKPSYRAQPWSQALKKHVHVGYFDSEADAWNAIREWYAEHENVDGIVEFPTDSAIAELQGMIREALAAQAETAAEVNGDPDADD
jgi:hypothetical protein